GEMASAAGLVSMHFVNVTDHRATVAPFRGTDARFVTNPVCIAVPGTDRHAPLLLDMATSQVAMGKIRVAKNEGKPAPEGALIDAKGRPTRDPNVMYSEPHGALVPFGGHKGYALAVMTELLATALTGGPSIQPGNQRMGGVINNMFRMLVGPGRLAGVDWLRREIDGFIDYVKASPPADPKLPVLVPGEPGRLAQPERARGGTGGDAPNESPLVDRDVGHPVVENLLDLVQHCLALLHVQLAQLPLVQVLDLGDDAGRVGAALAHVRLEPRGGVGAGAADADDHVLELAVAPRRGERRPLHGPHLRPDADVLEIGRQLFAHREVGRPRVEIARVEAVRVARLGEEPPRLRGVEGIRLEELRELERARDQGAGGLREAQRLGLVERLPVDREAPPLPQAQVVPGRFRVPLVRQIEPEDRRAILPRQSVDS